MADFLSPILALTAAEDVVLKVTISLLILVLGHLGVRALNATVRSLWISKNNQSRKEIEEREETIQYLSYILDAGVILLTLLYLNAGITSQISVELVNFLPKLLSVILVGILGFIAINLFTKVGTEFMRKVGVESYFKEIGFSGGTLSLVTGLIKGFLYLLVLQIALRQIGIGDTFINELVTASSWAAAALAAALIFWGFKDLFRNFAAGVYLQNSRLVRPGEEVRMDGENGEIRDISVFSTTVNTEEGYTLLQPNTAIMDSALKFKRTKNDIETLEEIKSYFVADSPQDSGQASAEMALDIFGHRNSQSQIKERQKNYEGSEKAQMIQSIEDLTNNNVKGAFVQAEKIQDMENELKAWFNDGALVLPSFRKQQIFPDSEGGEYVLSVGIEEDEVLSIDPNPQTGGVYFIGAENFTNAMEPEDNGYIVLAPKGTTAYWRIKNDLIYSNKNQYEEISKTLEARLTKILRQGRILDDVMPENVRGYIEDWRADRYASRLWKPTGEEDVDEASEDN
jgi:small-conductance mechanosensitive channel